MSKFKKGDRVRNLVADRFLNIGDLGTVNEDNAKNPYVNWDGKPFGELGYAQNECNMEQIAKPSREIITIRRKKKAVVATITDGENTYSQFTKLSDANGDFKTAVKMVVERLLDKWKVEVKADGNFKAKCISKGHDNGLTEGKVYEFVDGFGKWDGGTRMPQFENCGVSRFGSFSDLLKWFSDDESYKWEEVKDNTTLTAEGFDWDGFKQGKFAVHCDSEMKAREFLKECDAQGIEWVGHDKASNDTCWSESLKDGILYFKRSSGLTYSHRPEWHKNDTIIDYTPSKPTYTEVHRPAKVGEWIKVVDLMPHHHPSVNIGAILKVDHLCACDGTPCTKSVNNFERREYAVLENYQPGEPKADVKDEARVEDAPKPFVKAKVGDKIKVVKVNGSHVPEVKVGSVHTVKEVSITGIWTNNGNAFRDNKAEYIILDSSSDKPVGKPISEYTKEELIKELFNRVSN